MIPYMNLPNAKKGIELYQKIFDAKVLNHQPYTKERPPQGVSEDFDYENSTMYAMIEIFGQTIHMSDGSKNLSPMGMVDIYLELDTLEQINNIFEKAQETGCKINLPLGKQFWGAYYTNFKDPVGVTWQLSCTAPESEGKTADEVVKEEKKSSAKKATKKTSKKASSSKSSPKKTGAIKTSKKKK